VLSGVPIGTAHGIGTIGIHAITYDPSNIVAIDPVTVVTIEAPDIIAVSGAGVVTIEVACIIAVSDPSVVAIGMASTIVVRPMRTVAICLPRCLTLVFTTISGLVVPEIAYDAAKILGMRNPILVHIVENLAEAHPRLLLDSYLIEGYWSPAIHPDL
jgi:hypothetical protein